MSIFLICYGLYRPGPGDWSRWKEGEEKKDVGHPNLEWNKRTLFAETRVYISSIKWLLSHYKEWNFASCNKMDSLIHTRSLKRVTEGSHWKESKQVPFPMISVLRTAWSSARSCFPELIRNRESLRNGTQRKKMQHIGFLKVECPLKITPFLFFS